MDLGASDVAAICGIDPYRTAWDVWAEKTGIIEHDTDSSDGGDAIEIGNALEPVLRRWAEDRVGPIRRVGLERRITGTPVLCHLDGITEDGLPTEIKTTGFSGAIVGVWGADATEIVPDYVRVQLTVQMMATESERGYVIAWLGGVGRRLYPIDRSDKLCLAIRAAVEVFWDCVSSNKAPMTAASIDVAKHVHRVEGSVAQVDPVTLAQLREAREERLALSRREKLLMGHILAQMGDSEVADGGDGGKMTYLSQESIRLDQRALKADYPDAYAACVRKSRHRVARFKNTSTRQLTGEQDAN